MAQGQQSGLAKALQQRFALPDTLKIVTPFPFAGMNTQASRLALDDKELFYVENYIKVGDGFYRTLYDIGTPLFVLGSGDNRTIISFSAYNIGLTNYFIVFFNDGSADQVDLSGNITTISAAGSNAFYHTNGSYPATVQWGNIYLLISNNNTANDYWAWDGSLLYTAGTISPQIALSASGQNYVTGPAVNIVGGHGSGVSLAVSIANGSVVSLEVLNPGSGYVPGDVVQALFAGGGSDTGAILTAALQSSKVDQIAVLAGGSGYTSAPTVGFSGGGGSGATATATVSGGKVTAVTVTNGGSGYTNAPTISFTGGGGTGAQAQATLVAVGVGSVSVTNGGTNYFAVPTLTFEGGGGSGAAGTAVMSGPGPIASITVTAGGSGYTSIPTVSITDPNGTGATAIVSGVTNGVVTAITVTFPGTGYTSPSVSFSGGGGSGATATAAIGAGSISSVTMTNPGAGYVAVPAVIVQSGVNNAAQATLQLMPFGISGDSIETYQSQVWVQNPFQAGTQPSGGVRNSSAPDSISDFAASAGGLSETVTDRFLRRHLSVIRQSNGFLYPFGDSSVGVISNVNVTGTPPVKTLTNQNTDPQTGTHWRDTVQDFGRTVLFANPFGIYGLFGGAVTKISAKMDGIFNTANFPTSEHPGGSPITPSSAVANIYNRKAYLELLSITDPFTGAARNAMVGWNEQDWFIASQSITLTYIGTQEINSELTAWGTDGRQLVPLFQTPSATLTKKFSTKLYGADRPYLTKLGRVVYVQAKNYASQTSAPAFNVTIDTEYASFPTNMPAPAFPLPGQPLPSNSTPPPVNCPILMAPTGDIACQEIGLTMTSTGADHGIYYVGIATEDIGAVFG